MKFFNFKRKKINEPQVNQIGEPVKDINKELEKKRRESASKGFASVISESSIEGVLPDFKKNTNFIANINNKKIYIGVIINAADIGGVNKKYKSNPDVGQFIEHVNNGKTIIVCETQDLIDKEKFFIVPIGDGLTMIDEILCVRNAPWSVAYIDDDGVITETDISTTFDEINGISGGSINISVIADKIKESQQKTDINKQETDINKSNQTGADDSVENIEEQNTDEQIVSDTEESDDDDYSIEDYDILDEYGNGQGNNDSLMGGLPVYEPDMDSEGEIDEDLDDDNQADDDDDEGILSDNSEIFDEREFSFSDFRDAVTLTFFNDDLDLKVSTDHFDSLFLHWNDYHRFDTSRPDGWINRQLNEISKEANHDLAELHDTNLLKLRERYTHHTNEAAQEIYKKYDITNPETYVGKKRQEIDNWRKNSEMKIIDEITNRRGLIEDEFNKDQEVYVNSAMESARRSYMDRYGAVHRAKLENAEKDVRNELMIEYEHKIQELQDERRSLAKKDFDDYLLDVTKGIGEDYQIVLDEESRIYKNWRDRMSRFVDDNRKDEIVNNKVKLEELNQTKQADKVREEFLAKIDAEAKLFESKLEAHKKDLESLRGNYEEKLRINQEALVEERSKFKKERDELRFDLENMTNRYQLVKSEVKKDFEAQIAQAEDDKKAWSDKYDTLVVMHKKTNGLYIGIASIAVVAALAFGVVMGTYLNLSIKNDNSVIESIDKFDKKLKEVDEQNKQKLDTINKQIESEKSNQDNKQSDKKSNDKKSNTSQDDKTLDSKKSDISDNVKESVNTNTDNDGEFLKITEPDNTILDKFFK